VSAHQETKTGGKGGVLALGLLTFVAAGAGAAHGLQTFAIIVAAGPKKAAGPSPAGVAAPASGHGEGAPTAGHGAPAQGAPAKPAEKLKLPSKIVTRNLQPLITNIMLPNDLWVRLEAAIAYDQAEVDDPDMMLTEISGDLMAYLRTLTLREMQGADGLMFVRQDMRERIGLRTRGQARDIIIQTLVVQ
jgi:hypothetical protein